MKRTVTIILALFLVLSIIGGCAIKQPTTTAAPTTGKPTTIVTTTATTKATTTVTTAAPTEPVKPTVTWMMRNIGTTLYNNPLKVYEYLGAAGNLTIKPIMVAPDVYMDKLSIAVAGNDLPDIVNIGNQDLFIEALTPDFLLAKEIGPKGLIVPLSDNLDKLPNYKIWLDKFAEYAGGITSSDGKIYFASVVRAYNPTSSLGGVIRSDLADTMKFDTFETLFNTLKTMRDKSDGPIWVNRSGILNLNLLSYSFGTSLTEFPYYDQYAKTFINSVATPNFKDAILFFKSLVDADILTKEWTNFPEPQWYIDSMNGSCQFWVDNMMNVPTHNNGLITNGLTGTFKAFVPPSYGGKFYGWPGKSRFSTTGSIISAKTKALDNILAMFDWTYNLAASHDKLYWGEPGITCKQLASGEYGNTKPGVQSEPAFIKLITDIYGVGENSNWMKVFTDVEYYNDRQYDGARKWAPEGKVYGDSVYTYSVPSVNLSTADAAKFKELYTPLQTYIDENVTNFINSKKDISEFDAFVAKVKEMGADTLVELYNKK